MNIKSGIIERDFGGMKMYRVLVADGLNREQIQDLKDLGFDVIDQFYDGEELG